MLHAVLYEEAFQFHCDRAGDDFQPLTGPYSVATVTRHVLENSRLTFP